MEKQDKISLKNKKLLSGISLVMLIFLLFSIIPFNTYSLTMQTVIDLYNYKDSINFTISYTDVSNSVSSTLDSSLSVYDTVKSDYLIASSGIYYNLGYSKYFQTDKVITDCPWPWKAETLIEINSSKFNLLNSDSTYLTFSIALGIPFSDAKWTSSTLYCKKANGAYVTYPGTQYVTAQSGYVYAIFNVQNFDFTDVGSFWIRNEYESGGVASSVTIAQGKCSFAVSDFYFTQNVDDSTAIAKELEISLKESAKQNHEDLTQIEKSINDGNSQSHEDMEDIKDILDNQADDEYNKANEKMDGKGQQSSDDVSHTLNIDGFKESMTNLYNTLTYTGTSSVIKFPSAHNVPFVGDLWDEQNIDLTEWLSNIPDVYKVIVNFLFVFGVSWLIINDIKGLISFLTKGDES